MDTVLDGPASPSISERPQSLPEEVRAHFDGCPACRGQWQLLSRAEAALRAPRIVPAPDGMLAEFRDRLAAEERHAERRPVNPFARWLWPMGSLAAAGLAAAFVISMNVQPHLVEQPSPVRTSNDTTMARGLTTDAATKLPEDAVDTHDVSTKVDDSFGRRSEMRGNRARRPIVPPKPPVVDRPSKPEANVALEDMPSLSKADSDADPSHDTASDKKVTSRLAEGADVHFDVQPPAAAFKAKSQASIKPNLESNQRYLKKASDRMALNRAETREPALEGARSGGLGGFGGIGLGGGALGAPVPAGPPVMAGASNLAAKGDLNQRGAREEAVDRLMLIAEHESLVAAEVSPALVTALQRPVSLKQRKPESVLTVLGRLSREADIEVQLEGKVSQLALSIQVPVKEQKADEQLSEKDAQRAESHVPLWVALQSVALQGKLQVVPEENRLILRPLDVKAPKGPGKPLIARQLVRPNVALKQEVRVQTAPALAPTAKPAPGQQGVAKAAAAAEPRTALYAAPANAQNVYYFAYQELPNPDPRVWPSMWGDLPKWLFTLPEERPENTPAAETK